VSDAPALVWFRLDLRLSDSGALHRALVAHRLVIPVFLWAPTSARELALAAMADSKRRGNR